MFILFGHHISHIPGMMQHTSSSTGTQAIKPDQACNSGKQRMTDQLHEGSSAGRILIRASAEGPQLKSPGHRHP